MAAKSSEKMYPKLSTFLLFIQVVAARTELNLPRKHFANTLLRTEH